ncbi:MAG: chromate transporter [Oscillospiraceae bacterium]|jgi:chromate transporter
MTIYLTLFWEFFKTGLFAIGGGLAALPFLQDMADRTVLFTDSDLADMIAISEATPGPIGINSATYFGYKVAGIFGGFIATAGYVLPSIIIILIVAKFLKAFGENRIVQNTLYGLRPASTALIAAAGVSVVKIALLNLPLYTQTGVWTDVFNLPCIILAAVIFILIRTVKGHPVLYILGAAVVGAVFRFAGA